MKLVEIRLPHEPDKAFIFYHENGPFAKWHNHPEYELVLITKGWGKRSIGDYISRFEPGDLILMGPYLPHEYICDDECFSQPNGMQSECVCIQFDHKFLGEQFFKLTENEPLLKVMKDSNYGCRFLNTTGKTMASVMMSMIMMDDTDRLYALFSIFGMLSKTTEYELLSTPQFIQNYMSNENEVMIKVTKYMLQNFQEDVKINDLLKLSYMSNTAFSMLFKKTYRMTFKEYLLKIRVGYACRLLIENSKSISEIAFHSGFKNISNFNRQFKKIKKISPSKYTTHKTKK